MTIQSSQRPRLGKPGRGITKLKADWIWIFLLILIAGLTLSVLPTLTDQSNSLPSIAPLSSGGPVVINEIHFKPPDKTLPEEFIELHNLEPRTVDLSGWFFSKGIAFTFPEGTTMAPSGFLVVAEDPKTLIESFKAVPKNIIGPYSGRLANEGERIILRNANGQIEDQVRYGVGFPWPVASAGRGSSLELINRSLDNELAGSWRASGFSTSAPIRRRYLIAAQDENWRYRKGKSPASSPESDWRQLAFPEDETWQTGRTCIGYGDDDDQTVLTDMQNQYASVYLRHKFSVTEGEEIPALLKLRVYVDDGCIIWINGKEVARIYISAGEKTYNDLAINNEAIWLQQTLHNMNRYITEGANILAVHVFNHALKSSDLSFDAELFIPGDHERDAHIALPTPGKPNSVFALNAPPQIRRVEHIPVQPASGKPIIITAKFTDPDGVESAFVDYQIVQPGNFIPAYLPLPHKTLLPNPNQLRSPNPAFEEKSNWRRVAMRESAVVEGKIQRSSPYGAEIPGQNHRVLIRYRITATDTKGLSITVPYADDPSLNFACFVYDGVPPFTVSMSSVHPEGPWHVYDTDIMSPLPIHHLLTREEDLTHCLAYDPSLQIPMRKEESLDRFNWEGAFVYDGAVYDHIKYRLRHANDRYGGRGKRSMRFRFNQGQYFRAKNVDGRYYPTRWRTLNTGRTFDNRRIGNFGLVEAINSQLWNMVGVPAPWVYFFHFRVIDHAEEAPKGSNGDYPGDFWGLFTGMEDYDARFLDAHGLTDGNLYKLKRGIFRGDELKRNQGRFSTKSDVDFQNIRKHLHYRRSSDWLNTHVNYDRWYPYHAVVKAVRHYDFAPADSHLKNRVWYFEPHGANPHGRLWNLPHDFDTSWGPNANEGIDYPKKAIFRGSGKPKFKQEYRNFIREFRDLLWTEEVIHPMIEDLADRIRRFSYADRDRWKNDPTGTSSRELESLDEKVEDMKNFAFTGWSGKTGPRVPEGGRARHLDDLANAGGDATQIPETPVATSLSPPHYPIDSLIFTTTPFSDPQGNGTFAAIKWRIGEISDSNVSRSSLQEPRIYEWKPVWESEVSTGFKESIQIPPTVLKPGHTYRVRVKVKDTTNRWSHWSDPVEFTTGPSQRPFPQQNLRITEIMYHPRGDSEFEFIELHNPRGEAIDLSDVKIAGGIQFSFADSAVKQIESEQYLVIVNNLAVFSKRYDVNEMKVAGGYSGNLSNAGERIILKFGEAITILDFLYNDAWEPATDGQGYSLVLQNPNTPPVFSLNKTSWRPSAAMDGSPGVNDL